MTTQTTNLETMAIINDVIKHIINFFKFCMIVDIEVIDKFGKKSKRGVSRRG